MPSPQTRPPERTPEPLQPVAALLALLFPGAGHLYLGYTRRALLIAAGVLGLFAGGLLIGGIDAVDKREDFFWFFPQAGAGPLAFGTDWVHQNRFKAYDMSVLKHNPRGPGWAVDTTAVARVDPRSAAPGELRVTAEWPELDSRNQATGRTIGLPVFLPESSARADAPAGAALAVPNVKGLGRVNELGTLFCAIAGMMNLICVIDAVAKHRALPREGTL